MIEVTPMPDRCYLLPWDEYTSADPAEVFTSWLDHSEAGTHTVEIEEWSVHPPRHHLPSVARVLDTIETWAAEEGEVAEDYYERCEHVYRRDDVKTAADALLNLIASHITYRMAAEHVATLSAVVEVPEVGDVPEPVWTRTEVAR